MQRSSGREAPNFVIDAIERQAGDAVSESRSIDAKLLPKAPCVPRTPGLVLLAEALLIKKDFQK